MIIMSIFIKDKYIIPTSKKPGSGLFCHTCSCMSVLGGLTAYGPSYLFEVFLGMWSIWWKKKNLRNFFEVFWNRRHWRAYQTQWYWSFLLFSPIWPDQFYFSIKALLILVLSSVKPTSVRIRSFGAEFFISKIGSTYLWDLGYFSAW